MTREKAQEMVRYYVLFSRFNRTGVEHVCSSKDEFDLFDAILSAMPSTIADVQTRVGDYREYQSADPSWRIYLYRPY